MKSTAFYLVLALLIVVGTSLLVGCAGVAGSYNLTVSLTEQGMHVKHDKMLLRAAADLVISYADVQSVQVLNEAPKLKKTVGLNNSNALIGEFKAEGIGDVTVYTLGYKAEGHKYVSVKTKDATYLFSPAAPQGFVDSITAKMK